MRLHKLVKVVLQNSLSVAKGQSGNICFLASFFKFMAVQQRRSGVFVFDGLTFIALKTLVSKACLWSGSVLVAVELEP